MDASPNNYPWPCYPNSLSEVLGEDDKELLVLLQSGLQEKLHLPTRIVEFINSKPTFFDSFNKLSKYRKYCLTAKTFGNECENESISTAKDYIENNYYEVKEYTCYLGLTRYCYGIRVAGRLVAVCIAGKFRTSKDIEKIKNSIRSAPLKSNQKHELIAIIGTVPQLDDREIKKTSEVFKETVDSISRLAHHWFNIRKETAEALFLKQQGSLVSTYPAPKTGEEFRKRAREVLKRIKEFIGCEYLAIFSAREPSDIDLSLTAQSGLPDDVEGHVHFNWLKAGLPDDDKAFDANDESQIPDKSILIDGIKGMKSSSFNNVSYMQPYQFANGHRGMMVIGPFTHEVNIEFERRFLHHICHLIGLRILGMVVLRSLEDKDKRRDFNIQLAAHGIRSGLHSILSEADEISQRRQLSARNAGDEDRIELALDMISRQVDALAQQTAIIMRSPKEILNELDPTELVLERASLAVLLQNCIAKYTGAAKKKNININVDVSIDLLPEIKIDVILLDLAFSNIMDNAVKYSYENKEIRIRAEVTNYYLQVFIQNFGYPIEHNELQKIFEKGYRSKYKRDEKSIIGLGLGLNQTIKLLELHGGKIEAVSTNKDDGAVVLFKVTLPLK